jgi:hypothetical protein
LFGLPPVISGKCLSHDPKTWVKRLGKQTYKEVFVCARSFKAGHEPFEIRIRRGWNVKIAPWLKLCLNVLQLSVAAQGLPFPIPGLTLFDQCEINESIPQLCDDPGKIVLAFRSRLECQARLAPGEKDSDKAYMLLSEKATKERGRKFGNPRWFKCMIKRREV